MSLLQQLHALQHCDHIFNVSLRTNQLRTNLVYLRLKNGECTAAPRNGIYAIIGEWPTHRLVHDLPSVPIVALQRSNVMKHALSLTHTWENHARSEHTAIRYPALIDFDRLLCRAYNILMARDEQFTQNVRHTVWYEDLQTRPERTIHDLLHALNVSNSTTKTPVFQRQVMFKTGSDNLRTYVLNFHNISNRLRQWPCLYHMWHSHKVERFYRCPLPLNARCAHTQSGLSGASSPKSSPKSSPV